MNSRVGIVTDLIHRVIHEDLEVPQVPQPGGMGQWSWGPLTLHVDGDLDLSAHAWLRWGWSGLPSHLVLQCLRMARGLPKASWGLDGGVSTWEVDEGKGDGN